MGFTSRDMYAKVDNLEIFRRAFRRSELSYQALAEESARELRQIGRLEKRRKRGADVPQGISKSLIEQLLNGKANKTHELRAVAIEKALGVAMGELFVPIVDRGAHTTQRKTA